MSRQQESAPAPSGRKAHTKACACTGVRWCARCLDEDIRRAHRMDAIVQLPPCLATRPTRAPREGIGAEDARRDGRPGEFDPVTQSAPLYPDFEGVLVFPGFLSEGEADDLLCEIEATPFLAAQSGKWKQHFGPRINFNKQKLNAAAFKGLPAYSRRIEARLREIAASDPTCSPEHRKALSAALADYQTTDVFVLRYLEPEASNLDFHIDDQFAYGELILDLSLESDSFLTFIRRREEGPTSSHVDCVRVPLPARSLAVVFSAARSKWEHAILSYDIRERRTSVTLRTLETALRTSEAGRQIMERAKRTISPPGQTAPSDNTAIVSRAISHSS